MHAFTGSIEIDRPPAEVFAFLSDIRNMPRYLPTVRYIVPQGPERVTVEGEAEGRSYRDEGWLRVEAEERRMRWGSTGEGTADYHGELEVRDLAGRAEVRVSLHMIPRPGHARRLEEEGGSVEHAVRLALGRTLGAIKAACEGTATAEPAAKDIARSADDLRDSRPFGSSATLNPDI